MELVHLHATTVSGGVETCVGNVVPIDIRPIIRER